MPVYTVIIHKNEDGNGYWATCAVDGKGSAFTSGDTIRETQINMYESFSLLIEDDYQDITDFLLKYGCRLVSVKGSHFKITNPRNNKVAPIPVHSKKDMSRGFMKAILSQLDIDVQDFLNSFK